MNSKQYSDAARRMADAVSLHIVADPANAMKWIAVRLADGTADPVVYDTRCDAVSHHWWDEKYWAFVQLHPGGMQYREAEVFLAYHRALYDAGFRLPDPDFAMPMMPLTAGDRARQIQVLSK